MQYPVNIGCYTRLASLLIVFSLSACGGGGSSSAAVAPDVNTYASGFNGVVQKGPFIIGSAILVSELNDDVTPTGRVFNVFTKNDFGHFDLPATDLNRFVEVSANGYFMDETTGQSSTAQTQLSALIDLEAVAAPTLNTLTTLQRPRMKKLISDGMIFDNAKRQSIQEVLAVFNVPLEASGITDASDLSLIGGRDQDAVMTAIASILMQAAVMDARAAGTSSAAAITELVNRLSIDLSDNGIVDDAKIAKKIGLAVDAIDLKKIRLNIINYYADRDLQVNPPKFEEWIDKKKTGALPQRESRVGELHFIDVIDAEASQFVSSNNRQISGLGSGVSVPVKVTGATRIIKNGVLVEGQETTAVNGDLISVRIESGLFRQSVSVSVTIGGTERVWNVTTRDTELGYRSPNEYEYGQFGQTTSHNVTSDSVGGKKFNAFPIQMHETFTARYLATSMRFFCNIFPKRISLHTDNDGAVGDPIAHVNSYDLFFPGNGEEFTVTSTQQRQGGLEKLPNNQSFLGVDGIELSLGQKLWVVVETPDFGGCAEGYQFLGFAQPDFATHHYSDDGVNWESREENPYNPFIIISQ
jgi:hypothetical protein